MDQAPFREIDSVLAEVIAFLEAPASDVNWSTFDTPKQALGHLRSLREQIKTGDMAALGELVVLFLPTGDLQEISLSSGWANQYIELSDRFDRAARSISESSPVLSRRDYGFILAAITAVLFLLLYKAFS